MASGAIAPNLGPIALSLLPGAAVRGGLAYRDTGKVAYSGAALRAARPVKDMAAAPGRHVNCTCATATWKSQKARTRSALFGKAGTCAVT